MMMKIVSNPNPNPRAGKLVLVMGPSGVGKSVILRELRSRHPELHFPRSATTRARRPNEGDDLYRFVSEEEFDQLMRDEKLLEWAHVHDGPRYGTLKEEILPMIDDGKIVVREVDVQGFESIRHDPSFSGDAAEYQLQSIFILPESTDQLMEHIQKRAPMSAEELTRRKKSMETELTYADLCDVRIRNHEGKLEQTIKEVESAITG